MLGGAMAELKVGDPGLLSTDVGPVIDADALATCCTSTPRAWTARRADRGGLAGPGRRARHLLRAARLRDRLAGQLEREVFGPVLHVLRSRRRTARRK
jgi:RHH-type transcriptional regulator, proline utilization regulon repressor / proline dehydrogenase / delta 1-pyrroline-5-carboxylate dehydrogenase